MTRLDDFLQSSVAKIAGIHREMLEQLAAAYALKTGLSPEDVVLCEQTVHDETGALQVRFWLERKTDLFPDLVMRSKFDCTPEQYHAGLDKLWSAIGPVDGASVPSDAFTLAAEMIKTQASQLRTIATMLGWVNMPPFSLLEMNLRALKAHAKVLEEKDA